MEQDVQRTICKDLVFVVETKMKKGLNRVYREIAQECAAVDCALIPETIANAETERLPTFVSGMRSEIRTQLGVALDTLGISRDEEQEIWMNAMSHVSMPQLGLCSAKLPQAGPGDADNDEAFRQLYRQMIRVLAPSAALTGAGGGFVCCLNGWLIALGILLLAAGMGGVVYSLIKFLRFKRNESARIQLSPGEIEQYVENTVEAQRQLNERIIADWIRRSADCLANECSNA